MRVGDQTHLRVTATEVGRVLLDGTALILLAALVVPAFGVLTSLAAVLLTALVAGFVFRPRVRIKTSLPESVVAGQAVRLGCKIENPARVPAYQLSIDVDSLPASIERVDCGPTISRLAPGETAEVSLALQTRRRGRFLIPAPACRSGFPFNMFIFALSRDEHQPLLVLPPVYPMRVRLQGSVSRTFSTESGQTGRTEISPEYAGNRPFVAGDSPRRIDVRAWARLSVPATKEYYTDHDKLAMLVLDNRVRTAAGKGLDPADPFEAAVCLCASAASAISRDCLIDSVLVGSTLHPFSEMPKADRFDAVHQMLATVEPSDDFDLEPVWQDLEGSWRRTSEVVLVLLSWDRTYGKLIELAARVGCHTTVFLVDSSTSRAGSRKAPAIDTDSEIWAQHSAVLSPREILEGRIGDP
jgi:hypothetical protein